LLARTVFNQEELQILKKNSLLAAVEKFKNVPR